METLEAQNSCTRCQLNSLHQLGKRENSLFLTQISLDHIFQWFGFGFFGFFFKWGKAYSVSLILSNASQQCQWRRPDTHLPPNRIYDLCLMILAIF